MPQHPRSSFSFTVVEASMAGQDMDVDATGRVPLALFYQALLQSCSFHLHTAGTSLMRTQTECVLKRRIKACILRSWVSKTPRFAWRLCKRLRHVVVLLVKLVCLKASSYDVCLWTLLDMKLELKSRTTVFTSHRVTMDCWEPMSVEMGRGRCTCISLVPKQQNEIVSTCDGSVACWPI